MTEEVLEDVLFFLQTVSLLAGASGITLILQLKNKYETEMYKWLRTFGSVFFIYHVATFLFFYHTNFAWNSNICMLTFTDICLVTVLYAWMKVICQAAGVEDAGQLSDKGFKLVGAVYVLAGLSIYLYAMDQDFHVLTAWARNLGMANVGMLALTTLGGSAAYLIKGMKAAERRARMAVLALGTGLLLFLVLYFCEGVNVFLTSSVIDESDFSFLDLASAALYLSLNVLFITYVIKDKLLAATFESDAVSEPARHSEDQVSFADISGQYGLTEREKEVLLLVSEGHGNSAIADKLCISPFTVKRHMNSIFRKVGVKTRVELIQLVIPAR